MEKITEPTPEDIQRMLEIKASYENQEDAEEVTIKLPPGQVYAEHPPGSYTVTQATDNLSEVISGLVWKSVDAYLGACPALAAGDLKDMGYDYTLLKNLQNVADAMQSEEFELKVTEYPTLRPMQIELIKSWQDQYHG